MSDSSSIIPECSSAPNVPTHEAEKIAGKGADLHSSLELRTVSVMTTALPAASPLQRTRKKLWKIVAVAAVVVMVAGGGAYAVYANFFQRGASSPEAVMGSLSKAISNKDITTLYKMVSPEEIDTISESSEVIKNSGGGELGQNTKNRRTNPGSLISNEAISQYLESIHVSTSKMNYDVDQKSENIAVAKISSWNLKISVGQDLASNLRARYQNAKGVSLSRDESNFFDDLDLSRASYDGDVAKSFSESIPLEIVMVRESGRWYVSPLMTMAQWSYQDRVHYRPKVEHPNYSADFNKVSGAKTAEGAVEQLTEEILGAHRPSDLLRPEVTNLLAVPERRLVMVYGPTLIGGDDRYSEPLSRQINIDWSLESTDIGNGRAVVRPGKTKVVLNPDNEYNEITLSFDDGEVDVTTSANSNNTRSVDFTRELANPERLGLVAENKDGTWCISTSKTIVNVFNLKPSRSALSDLSKTLSDLGVGERTADDVADIIASSTAIAAPVLVVADIADQIQDIEWTRDDYSSGDSNDAYFSRCSDGEMGACDSLYLSSPSGTYEESYGKSCGGRNYTMTSGGQCESTYGRRY